MCRESSTTIIQVRATALIFQPRPQTSEACEATDCGAIGSALIFRRQVALPGEARRTTVRSSHDDTFQPPAGHHRCCGHPVLCRCLLIGQFRLQREWYWKLVLRPGKQQRRMRYVYLLVLTCYFPKQRCRSTTFRSFLRVADNP